MGWMGSMARSGNLGGAIRRIKRFTVTFYRNGNNNGYVQNNFTIPDGGVEDYLLSSVRLLGYASAAGGSCTFGPSMPYLVDNDTVRFLGYSYAAGSGFSELVEIIEWDMRFVRRVLQFNTGGVAHAGTKDITLPEAVDDVTKAILVPGFTQKRSFPRIDNTGSLDTIFRATLHAADTVRFGSGGTLTGALVYAGSVVEFN